MKSFQRFSYLLVLLVLLPLGPVFAGPLHDAVKNNDSAAAAKLLSQGEVVSRKDDRERTPLYAAALAGRLSLVELFIANGADVNAASERDDGWTPLIVATYLGHRDVVNTLLQHGADIDAKDKDGYTALDWAFKEFGNRHPAIGKLLIQQGASMTDKQMYEFLDIALRDLDEAFVRILIERGASVNRRQAGLSVQGRESNTTLLHRAVDDGSLEKVKLLVEYGADVNARGSGFINVSTSGWKLSYYEDLTPLQLAAVFEQHFPGLRVEIARFLQQVSDGDLSRRVAAALTEYAAALKDEGQLEDAQRLAGQATLFKQSIGASESVYLGFDPSAVLKEYAEYLRKQDRKAQAKEMTFLAEWYYRTNLRRAFGGAAEGERKQNGNGNSNGTEWDF